VTFSIVARDPATGDLGVAVASAFLAVGSVVPAAEAEVGALATQAFANVAYGPESLALLRAGATADEAVAQLVERDEQRVRRQLGIVDRHGRSATYTGRACFAWAGGRVGEGFAAQGNILAGPGVVDAMAERFLAGGMPFGELLIDCLAAGESAGGDRRGRQAAALLVVRTGGGFGGANDRWLDLRVDDHEHPIRELARLADLHRLVWVAPSPDELVPLDEILASELRDLLVRVGGGPGTNLLARFPRMWLDEVPLDEPPPVVGDPRPLPPGWNDEWHQALNDWLMVHDLDGRITAPGWVDPLALSVLRERAT
jgi:uncharacterized Ntn-hydrolase superfamily protein